MDKLGIVTLKTLQFFGHEITIQPSIFYMTWLVMGIFLLLGILATRKLSLVPKSIQNMFEVIYEYLEDITLSTLGKEDGKKYVPFIVTLFVFILLANWIGVLPNLFAFLGTLIGLIHKAMGGAVQITVVGFTNIQLIPPEGIWYASWIDWVGFEEPTRSINTDLALAIIVFFLVQAYGIKNKGLYRFLRNFADDPFPMKGPLILFFFLNPFFYLNIIGAIANVVSHSFRLFGNIFGGSMIIVIGSSLLKYFLAPVGLFAFFGLFAGLVQAFVFAMLAITYIQQQQ